jgi:hypothetical protein
MNRRMMIWAMAFALAVPGAALGASKADEQADARKAAQDALAAVYKVQPSARKAVEACGWPRSASAKIFIAGGGSGKGMAVNNKPTRRT